MRKHDPLSLIMANLLFKSLNINMEQYIQKLQKTTSSSGQTASLKEDTKESTKSSAAPFMIKKQDKPADDQQKANPLIEIKAHQQKVTAAPVYSQ